MKQVDESVGGDGKGDTNQTFDGADDDEASFGFFCEAWGQQRRPKGQSWLLALPFALGASEQPRPA